MNKLTTSQAKQAANAHLEIKKLLEQGFIKAGFYEYQNANGEPIYWRIRLDPPPNSNKSKWIRPFHFDVESKQWMLKEPKFRGKKPLYRLPAIVQNPNAKILVGEGEPCIDLLAKLGLIATTSGSASSANAADWSVLAGRHVIVWHDNDKAGFKYACEVTAQLLQIGCTVKWIDIDKLNLSPKGDCVDWLSNNPEASKQDIEKLPLIAPLIEAKNNLDEFDKNLWDDPILFDEIETPEIPASLLPPKLASFALALAKTTETPEALSVMTVLGVVSSITSKCYTVSPKDGWQETTNLYIAIALPPAHNKSLVLNKCTAPLVEWECEQKAALEHEIKKQISELKTQEKIIERMRATVAKEKDPNKQKNLISEITEKESALKEPKALPCLFSNNTTPEGLENSIHEQNNHFAIFSDEGGIIEILTGLYTGGKANLDVVLKGIDGGHIRVRRQNRRFDINPVLTVVLAVQPVIIQRMGEKDIVSGNGFLERFLYVLPKSKLGYREHNNPPIPRDVNFTYNQIIRKLLDFVFKRKSVQKIILTLSPDALAKWKRFQLIIEEQLRPNGVFYSCQGWAGKICGFALRIAANLHVMGSEDFSNHAISGKTMDMALEIAALLTKHTIAAYSLMGADQVLADAKELFNWLTSQDKKLLPKTKITYAMRHRKIGKKERLNKALEILIERNILKGKTDNSTRKPTTNYLISPKCKLGR